MMRSGRLLLLALFVGGVLAGCQAPAEEEQPAQPRETGGAVEINIQNDSAVDFDSVLVAFPSQREHYGAVPSGQQSAYRTVTLAYGYAYVEAYVGDRKYVVQPTDYTGETPLSQGRYSYALSLENDELSLALIRR